METGSKLISETVEIFFDAVKLGGDPDVIGLLAADFASRTIMLRAKRRVTASTFTWLTVVMHGVVCFLMVMILEIVHNFVLMMGVAASNLGTGEMQQFAGMLPSFNAPQVALFRYMTIAMVLILSLVNAYAINATDGGHWLKISFQLAIMLFLAGVALLAAPPIIGGLLG